MDKLWAPWRMDYIEKAGKPGCFLCDALSSKDDSENLVLWRGKESFIIMNRYPYNCGHLMVVPNAHTALMNELTDKCRSELLGVSGEAVSVITREMNAEGFNIGVNLGLVAGAGVKDHLHLHVVPRWNGDTNFMPVLAETKSLPEYLAKTYAKLLPHFKKI